MSESREGTTRAEGSRIGRVLAVSPDASRTGAAPWLRDVLAWAAEERDVAVELIVMADGPLVESLRALGPVHVAPAAVTTACSVLHALRRPRWASAVRDRWLGRTIARVGPVDAVLAGSPATVADLRHHAPDLPPIVARVDAWGAGPEAVPAGSLDDACLVVAPTATTAEWAARASSAGGLGAPRERLRLHSGPVPPPLRHPRPDPDGSALVVGCGPVGWRSGTDLFVALAAAVGRSVGGRTVRFSWIGAGDSDGTGRDVVDDIALRGLDDLILLQGDLPDRADRLAASDLLVVTSRVDPYPVDVVEAALTGTPVVGFRTATTLLGEAGHDEVRVDHLDVDALAAVVIDLLSAPDRGRLLAGDLARAAAGATTTLAAAGLWADIEAAVDTARTGSAG